MNRYYVKLCVFTCMLGLISSGASPANAKIPSVGVKDGDSFDFIIEKLNNTDSLSTGYILGFDNEGAVIYTLQQGYEFTITFPNATPVEYFEDRYLINFDVILNDKTIFNDALLKTFTGLLSTTDWDAIIIPILQSDIDEINAEINANDAKIGSVSLINSGNEVGITGGFKANKVQESKKIEYSWEVDIRKERSTGVLLYQKERENLKITTEGETDTESKELILKRKGYSIQVENSGFIPGFEFPIILVVFSSFVLITQQRKRRNGLK